MKNRRSWLCLTLCGSLAATASAKVVFTGYADPRMTAQTDVKIMGSDAALAAAGVADRRTETRNFTMDSLGLFATTTFNEETDFLFDVTYKKIGATTGETRLQYAYLHYHTASLWEAKVGRVSLPIGLYNDHHFYPFQRNTVTPPIFQSAILGLPIADNGVIGAKTVDLGPLGFTGTVYVVNGYGSSRASTETFRPGLGATDALLIINNFRETNNNDKFSYGGRAEVSFPASRAVKTGVSTYEGAWSPDGKSDFSMLNAFLALEMGPVSLLMEGLRTDTDNDKGVAGFFGGRDWKSEGGFLEAGVRVFREGDRSAVLFAGTEETVARGKGNGTSGRERITQHKAGVAWRVSPFIQFKTQLGYIGYRLPLQIGGVADSISFRARNILFNFVLTY